MTRQRQQDATDRTSVEEEHSAEVRQTPTEAERKGKRGHDEHGNVRPADDRYELHDPADESLVVRTPESAPVEDKPARKAKR